MREISASIFDAKIRFKLAKYVPSQFVRAIPMLVLGQAQNVTIDFLLFADKTWQPIFVLLCTTT